jgi:hypothetical protein
VADNETPCHTDGNCCGPGSYCCAHNAPHAHDDVVLPTNCNCTEGGLPYCGRPDCDIDWCWYCGDEYTEPCPRHEGVDHV